MSLFPATDDEYISRIAMTTVPSRFEVRHDDDAPDAKLICRDCWHGNATELGEDPGYLCDIEHGDSLWVLVSVALRHERTAHA